ncbi:MAG: hypothetical protein QXT63_00700 [Thermoplasmata archaeon]
MLKETLLISIVIFAIQAAAFTLSIPKNGRLLKLTLALSFLSSLFFLIFAISETQVDSFLMLRLALLFSFWSIGAIFHIIFFSTKRIDDWFAPFLYLPAASLAFSLSTDRLIEDVLIISNEKRIVFGDYTFFMQIILFAYGLALCMSSFYNILLAKKEYTFSVKKGIISISTFAAGLILSISAILHAIYGIFFAISVWSLFISSAQYLNDANPHKKYELLDAKSAYLAISMLDKGIIVKALAVAWNFPKDKNENDNVAKGNSNEDNSKDKELDKDNYGKEKNTLANFQIYNLCKCNKDEKGNIVECKIDDEIYKQIPRKGEAILLDLRTELQTEILVDETLLRIAELIEQLEYRTMFIVSDSNINSTGLDVSRLLVNHPQRFFPKIRKALINSVSAVLSKEFNDISEIVSFLRKENDITLKRKIRDLFETHGFSCYELDILPGEAAIFQSELAKNMLAAFCEHDYDVALITTRLEKDNICPDAQISIISYDNKTEPNIAINKICKETSRLSKNTLKGKIIFIEITKDIEKIVQKEGLEKILTHASETAKKENIRIIISYDEKKK